MFSRLYSPLDEGMRGVITRLIRTDSNAGACVVKWKQNRCIQQSSPTLMVREPPHWAPSNTLPDQETPCVPIIYTFCGVPIIYKFCYVYVNSEEQRPRIIHSLILAEMQFYWLSLFFNVSVCLRKLIN